MEKTRLLVWGKTYPEFSRKHRETVCTGAVTEDGEPIRLYPIRLRYLPEVQQFKNYQWIRVGLAPGNDGRLESRRVTSEIELLEEISSANYWRRRRELIFARSEWHFACLNHLKNQQQLTTRSIGCVPIREVSKIWIKPRDQADVEKHEAKAARFRNQRELFHELAFRELSPQKHRVHVQWTCVDPACPSHTAGIYDWGLAELVRRVGVDSAMDQIRKITDVEAYDTHFFVGNFRQYPANFGIVGIWYPKIQMADDSRQLLLSM